jgi:transmembrane sensor
MAERRVDPERDPIYAVAADWLVRLHQSEVSLEDTLAWQQWMEQDSRHRESFRALEETWEKFDDVPVPGDPEPKALREDLYTGSQPVSAWNARPAPRYRRHPWRLALAAMLLLAVICVVATRALAPRLLADLSEGKTYETAVGQNATIRLADGTEVQLGGHTQLSVSLSAHLRQIDLLQGEAYFAVAKDRSRPFLVRAGTATVTAVGTEFNVRRSDDRVVVSVLEGRVLVQPMVPILPVSWVPASRALGSAAPVDAGQRSTVNRHGDESTQAVGDTASAVQWQHGRMAFEAETLRYVVQDVNRYADKPIVIADARTGDLRVTGTVTEANILGWINSLEAAFGIHADIESDRIVLRRN